MEHSSTTVCMECCGKKRTRNSAKNIHMHYGQCRDKYIFSVLE